ncbi:MAG: hypothetical protein M5U14_17210 [Acidimicrobiia bacterium]|nr:hypothetical protein [Acidimicrobiia bacterium]
MDFDWPMELRVLADEARALALDHREEYENSWIVGFDREPRVRLVGAAGSG